MSEKSAKALGIEGSGTDLILTTIHGTRSIPTKAIEGLVVANIKEEDMLLDLPRTLRDMSFFQTTMKYLNLT